MSLYKLYLSEAYGTELTVLVLQIPFLSFTMGVEESVYLAKLAEQAERYEGQSFGFVMLIL